MSKNQKRWSQEEINFMVDNWHTLGAAKIAKALERSYSSVESAGHYHGVTRSRTKINGYKRELIHLYRQGWLDTEIAKKFNLYTTTVCRWRTMLGFPPIYNTKKSSHPEKVREKISRKVNEHIYTNGYTHWKRNVIKKEIKEAEEAGWPECMNLREVRYCELFLEKGQLSKQQVSKELNVPNNDRLEKDFTSMVFGKVLIKCGRNEGNWILYDLDQEVRANHGILDQHKRRQGSDGMESKADGSSQEDCQQQG
jgi:hypothetical protein